MTLVLLAVAGAAGTVTRHLVQGWVTDLTGDRLQIVAYGSARPGEG